MCVAVIGRHRVAEGPVRTAGADWIFSGIPFPAYCGWVVGEV